VVSYKPVLHPSAEKELNQLPESQRQELTNILKDVAETREPTTHPQARHLEGQSDKFRVRVGENRAICRLHKPRLEILCIGPRKDIYENINETLANRV